MPRVPRSRIFLFVALAVLGCAADLWTKHAMFSWPKLLAHEVHWVVPGHAGFELSLNEGGLFGMGQGAQAWLSGFSVMAAIAIPVWLFYFGAATDRVLTLALGGVMGGVLGNLYDRLGLHGLMWDGFDSSRAGEPVYAVRDFILFAWNWDPDPSRRIVWPNFNVADSLLVVGAALLFFRAVMTPADVPTDPKRETVKREGEP
jgi:signal peptidase II